MQRFIQAIKQRSRMIFIFQPIRGGGVPALDNLHLVSPNISNEQSLFDKPSVAEAVLQTAVWLIRLLGPIRIKSMICNNIPA